MFDSKLYIHFNAVRDLCKWKLSCYFIDSHGLPSLISAPNSFRVELCGFPLPRTNFSRVPKLVWMRGQLLAWIATMTRLLYALDPTDHFNCMPEYVINICKT